MSLTSIDKQNIVDEVYAQIKTNIVNGTWKPGDKIPSEHDLCQMFKVSRVSVRSAIQKMRAIGIITTRHGQGSFVSQSIQDRILNDLTPIMNITEKEFMDMMEFRETIEFKCIDLAVLRADEEDIRSIEQALEKMVAGRSDYKKYTAADIEFHVAIAKASKNEILYQVVKNTHAYSEFLEELNRVFGVSQESVQGHIEQFEALKRRDSEAVKALIKTGMNENIQKLRERNDP
ncbi:MULTISPECIES: FadR/GntR family transcriptional regulator [Paenibacillus]|uniref:FadR family transcriptional regulator n=1 Tax=Paenibacillus radicis (ex Xue et al. 2023) TaxID=2972489 RepID=A0ABT1YVD8_9BACL|nr:FadR/GntR family transcriptional regulator [Paenibacillus radicis (ex Xue et al. 2023)]MCR8636903.1 FadR family transcriptional regulator [Paenibacillus radicis (ex Xue et al. 2023)]